MLSFLTLSLNPGLANEDISPLNREGEADLRQERIGVRVAGWILEDGKEWRGGTPAVVGLSSQLASRLTTSVVIEARPSQSKMKGTEMGTKYAPRRDSFSLDHHLGSARSDEVGHLGRLQRILADRTEERRDPRTTEPQDS